MIYKKLMCGLCQTIKEGDELRTLWGNNCTLPCIIEHPVSKRLCVIRNRKMYNFAFAVTITVSNIKSTSTIPDLSYENHHSICYMCNLIRK